MFLPRKNYNKMFAMGQRGCKKEDLGVLFELVNLILLIK
jgi:hypothetical protein